MKTGFIASIAIACLLTGVSQPAVGAMISWADWTTATSGPSGSASGTMGPFSIDYMGEIGPPAQTSGGINYWDPGTPYISSAVDNAPPASDIIRLTGGAGGTNTITFDGAFVTNPVMAIVSLGQSGLPVQYDFDIPFEILSSGVGFWGGGTFEALSGSDTILLGEEGHGTIRFLGPHDSISWTVSVSENWHGFTVGTASVIPLPASVFLFGSALLALFGRRLGRSRL